MGEGEEEEIKEDPICPADISPPRNGENHARCED